MLQHLPISTLSSSSAASDVYKRQDGTKVTLDPVFNARKKEYTIVVPKTLESVVFKATARTAANSEIKVNGKIAENGEYTLALTGDDAKVVTEIEVGNENTVAGKYTVSILREEPVTITFETEPKDAIITVIDKDKIKAGGEDGIYKVLPGTYTYTVSKTGYVTKHEEICLLYTSDAADEEDSVDLGGRRIMKKKKQKE